MALSTCAKCGNHQFRLQETEPTGSNFKWFFVQCATCGVPVGAVDFYPNSAVMGRVEALEKTIKALEATLSSIEHTTRQIAQRVR